MPNINTAYQWAINTCNAPNIGYSQNYRNQQTIAGITYYDCSSFIYYALIAGGFALDPKAWPFTTATMGAVLESLGFKKTDPGQAVNGSIMWRSGHTEMMYDSTKGYTMGAHTSNAPLSDQVSIGTSAQTWAAAYTFGDYAGGYDWIFGNRYLNDNEQKNNAFVAYSILSVTYGWTLNAIAGTLGNMEAESTINPGVWQNLDEGNYSLGFGLVQWTPATNYTDWATGNGYDISDGDYQLLWLDSETVPSGQWIATAAYPWTFEEYKKSSETPEDCASAFLKNFERAGVEVESDRRQNARKWYNYLKDLQPWIPPTVNSKRKKKKWWLYWRKKYD